jgi:hypothetical protein
MVCRVYVLWCLINYMQSENILLRVVLALLLIVIGSQIYFFVSLHNLKTSGVANSKGFPSNAVPPGMATTSTSVANIVVGDDQIAYQGTITQLQSSSMQVKTPEKNVTFTISSDTKFLTSTTQKSAAEYNQEMTAYNAQVALLMEDPQKNAAALKALTVPPTFNQKILALSDFKVGDSVFVTPGAKNNDGSYAAVSVVHADTTSTQ